MKHPGAHGFLSCGEGSVERQQPSIPWLRPSDGDTLLPFHRLVPATNTPHRSTNTTVCGPPYEVTPGGPHRIRVGPGTSPLPKGETMKVQLHTSGEPVGVSTSYYQRDERPFWTCHITHRDDVIVLFFASAEELADFRNKVFTTPTRLVEVST